MDTAPESLEASSSTPALSYDDAVPYEEQVAASSEALEMTEAGRSLADRIGSTKVYLLSDASKSRVGKRKREDEDEDDEDKNDFDMNELEPTAIRDNAILLQGSPISHLPTSNIFAYATHFDAPPLALEWINDTTCILVFDSKPAARSAFRTLQKSVAEEPSLDDGSVTAKPIPVTIWPAEYRISKTLGQGEGLKGILRMRWARVEDVKKKGARNQSQFYRKYGQDAGKTFEEGPPVKKRRAGANDPDEAIRKAELDAELDEFLADSGDEGKPQRSRPSRMRSDYMSGSKKTLLERTEGLSERMVAPLPRRAREGQYGEHRAWDRGKDVERYGGGYEPRSRPRRTPRGDGQRRAGREPTQPRPKATREDLDAELDAFLDEKL